MPPPATDPPEPLPDRATSWRTETATRATVIVDADEYFAAARSAMLKAKHRILLIGWDFDARIDLGTSAEAPRAPRRVGRFILWLVKRNPDLQVYLLRWDMGALKSLFRGTTFITVARWMLHKRIRTKLDGAHPTGASHHQKIVIIDDCVAFCGGIDMTGERWDTRCHRDEEPRRRTPWNQPYKPWHDATTAVEGPVARALGDLFRDRWKRATGGEVLAPSPPSGDCWPHQLDADFTGQPIAISRTVPHMPDQTERREIEAMTIELIGRARRHIYAESQYFASRKVAEAIARRIDEPDGPEIILINPLAAQGWLEPIAMDTARARLIEALRRRPGAADRFRVYHPYTAGGHPIYVHAKILIVDDQVIRVGSSNFNNRSMALDTECDLTLDAGLSDDPARARARIVAIRDDLIAEHLGCDADEIGAAIDAAGSIGVAIERLRDRPGRTLRPYETPDLTEIEKWLADNELLDPESPDEMFESLAKRDLLKHLRWR
ncbi:phospholipase D-like domain-containing protein [Sphingomonas naphthae]|uniref:Phospholipase D n=1 Tax=Sphingomonas naphthae TaxID=1813468 RepID=A0ABY7TJD1_9SPHN|nr:phospholipase D-like domain-containing protein [Sphingomonas naphthae]WCT73336.1 phospholipase D-like domain-containing protein [Sphingomonas naphthae]